MSLNLSPQEEEVIKIISPIKFHRLFTLPATENHGPLKVSYSIAGPEDGDVPTILLVGGMAHTRWYNIWNEHLAQKEGVRILCIDRPSFGASTPVRLDQRLAIFLETVPALLAHLHIPHISLASHSSGTLFALNLLAAHPDLLSPAHPTITLISPWVHQSHTAVLSLVAASHLPNPLLNHWDAIIKFGLTRVSPALGTSSGALASLTGWFRTPGVEKGRRGEEEERKCREAFGITGEVRKELEKTMFRYVFEENTKGANDEARLCLKSTEGCGWLACEDYPEFVKSTKDTWENRVDANVGAGKLKIKIVLPEEDAMVGEKGKEYFKECWKQEKCGRGIEVECVEIKGTDHDSVTNPENGILESLFSAAKGQ
ncbi:Alpha/Beta hydrolase protein [Hyaloscypha finlandica]|nr:Alpha/Beta hydrolase protein [Hyaloscypha finlandica]